MSIEIRTLHALRDVPAAQWNALVRDADPFLDHAFLAALEEHGCLGEASGWYPHHLAAYDTAGRLCGACPLYLKTNSYGEFVFDWAWAEAFRRHGSSYYPKLVSAIPFTPATGQRLLLAEGTDAGALGGALATRAVELAAELGCSSVHWLLPQATELPALEAAGALPRLGCQFHWHNRGYRDFDDFLDSLTAKKRKNIRQERRRVRAAGLELCALPGDAVTPAQWRAFHRFYRDTFARRGGHPTLTLPFFEAVGRALAERVLLVLACRDGRPLAGALSFASRTTLYGRHWGAAGSFDALHFEACYYQGLEHCIARGLARFEPGAQGEHKVPRGFLPALTHSAHWIADARFRAAIGAFLARERPAVRAYAHELAARGPYREAPA